MEPGTISEIFVSAFSATSAAVYAASVCCFFLFPVYRTNPWDGISTEEGVEPTLVDGYFSVTMNSLEPRSPRLWVCWFFGFAFFAWILRRQWMEWETFITLRYNFLANGDVEVEEDPTSIEVMRRRLGLGDGPDRAEGRRAASP